MSKSPTSAGDLLLSLPLMERQDWKMVQSDLAKLGASDSGIAAANKQRSQSECANNEPEEIKDGQMQHIMNKVKDYQSKRYQCTARCSLEKNSDDGPTTWTIRTYCQHLDPSNCLAGSLSGEWTLQITTEKTAELTAVLAWHAHYAENVNVQTRSRRSYDTKQVTTAEEKVNSMVAMFEKDQMSYEEQLACAVIKKMEAWELEFYDALAGMEEAPDLVRPLRRILPITKTRFKWDSAAQRNVQLLNARKTA